MNQKAIEEKETMTPTLCRASPDWTQVKETILGGRPGLIHLGGRILLNFKGVAPFWWHLRIKSMDGATGEIYSHKVEEERWT